MPRFPLQPLLEHSQHRMEAAERLLRLLKRKEDEARSRLEQLEVFRGEYQDRLRQSSSTGMDIQRFREYQAFIAKIDGAIKSQAAEVGEAHARWEQAHQQWLAQRQKVKAYETLATRHQEKEIQRQDRRDQKASDDQSGRRVNSDSSTQDDDLA